ncbi:MAG: D-alanine--D-alanine ligase [Flammeovirgaceae bacterium]|nr:D-alanine--D-alanine ligase [Flammeovirgaceae bacterium]
MVNKDEPFASILERIQSADISFPFIAKPDFGERGWMVRKIHSADGLNDYIIRINQKFIIQEFVDLPLEFGVFYTRLPNAATGRVTSITGKEMLFVEGDGDRSLKELILAKDRSKLQWETLKIKFKDRLDQIPDKGERMELGSIGNHCLGTKFLNRNDLITDKVSQTFDEISKGIEGFYFGRYDLRTATEENLESGDFKVMELNGCGAEPSHIYDPKSSVWNAYLDLIKHWNTMYTISTINHKQGIPYTSFAEARKIYAEFKKYTK